MATNTKKVNQRRRDLFTDLIIRSKLKEEIISQVRSCVKYPEGTVFDVILKHNTQPPDDNGRQKRAWTARLVWYLKPGNGKYWEMGNNMPRSVHASPVEALEDMLMQLVETQFGGRLTGDRKYEPGEGGDGEGEPANQADGAVVLGMHERD